MMDHCGMIESIIQHTEADAGECPKNKPFSVNGTAQMLAIQFSNSEKYFPAWSISSDMNK